MSIGRRAERLDGRAVAAALDASLEGENRLVEGLAPADGEVEAAAVVVSSAAAAELLRARAPAVVVAPHGVDTAPHPTIRCSDARLALARLAALFDDRPLPDRGIHPASSVADDARIGAGVRIGAGAVVASEAVIGDNSVVGERAVVGAGARLGSGCRLHAGAVLGDGVVLGERCIVQSGAVIGSDGFGYALSPAGAVKIPHLGSVVVGDDVEIGANTCVDRGTLGDTRIGSRSKIDNLCQVAHNVVIGEDCLIAGHSAIAGSTVLGDRVVMAGGAGVADHLTIGRGAVLGPRATVLKDVPAGETWIGYPAQPRKAFARQAYLLSRLERIWRFVREREAGSE